MTIQIRQELTVGTHARLIPDTMGKQYDIVDFWEHQPKHEVTINTKYGPKQVQYVFSPPSWLNYVCRGEKFGAYIGDMMFISSNQKLVKPDWVPFVIVKLFGEKFIDQGLDESGKAKHYDALFRTIRLAATTMTSQGLHEFLSELVKHERERYFELDNDARNFLESNGFDPNMAKRAYLEKHHYNKWVNRGRFNEELANMGFSLTDGYRNHAEAIVNAFGDLDSANLYIVAQFIHTLNSLEPDTPVIIEPPYTAFAYNLTKDANDKVDLVKFLHSPVPREDVIVKVAKKQPTWTALGKRLSYKIHKVEEFVSKLIPAAKQSLDGLLLEAQNTHNEFALQIASVREMVEKKLELGRAQELFRSLSRDYPARVKMMDEVTQAAAQNLKNLEDLTSLLRKSI